MNQNDSELEAAQAAVWHARLRAEDCTLDERRAFEVWLARDSANRRAYERAQRLSRLVSQLAQVDPRLQALASEAVKDCGAAVKRPAMQWRMAAAVLLGVGVAALLVQQRLATGGHGVVAQQYSNDGNRQQLIELEDGSRVHLDVGARLQVRMGRMKRQLELHAGRAYFDVAHDTARPFSVSAGVTQTVALGTRFQVSLAEHAVSVTLDEGSVEVSRPAEDRWREVLHPGEQLQFDAVSGNRKRHEVDTTVVDGWTSGRLVFRSTPLADALEEINLYSDIKLRIGDTSLGGIPIGGTFEAGADSERVAAAIAEALSLDAVQVGAKEIALFRRYEATD